MVKTSTGKDHTLVKQGKLEPADESEDDIELLHENGVDFVRNKDYDNALNAFNKILKINPSNTHALLHKGQISSILGKWREALIYFDHVLERDPNNTNALFHSAYTLGNLGDYAKAIELYDRILN